MSRLSLLMSSQCKGAEAKDTRFSCHPAAKGAMRMHHIFRAQLTFMPSMVRLVSAMLVASTTFLAPTGVVSKMRACTDTPPLHMTRLLGVCQTEVLGLTGFCAAAEAGSCHQWMQYLSLRNDGHHRYHQSCNQCTRCFVGHNRPRHCICTSPDHAHYSEQPVTCSSSST